MPEEVGWGLAVVAQAAHEGDDEVAHSLLDDLYILVLEEIRRDACGECGHAASLAGVALGGESLEFARWCA